MQHFLLDLNSDKIWKLPLKIYKPPLSTPNLVRRSPLPLEKTQEVMRAPYYVLRDFRIGTDWTVKDSKTCFSFIRDYCKRNLFPHLTMTKHLNERLDQYVNRPTRNGKSVELFPEEREQLRTLTTWLPKTPDGHLNITELGFNEDGEICKIALTTYLRSRRVLFMCLGMNAGIKTIYVTDKFKHRITYGGQVEQSDSSFNMACWLSSYATKNGEKCEMLYKKP